MPQDYKTSINNLIVVWQGSSWSVIAPDGTVLYRSFSKTRACDFAESYTDYAGTGYTAYQEVPVDIPENPKNGFISAPSIIQTKEIIISPSEKSDLKVFTKRDRFTAQSLIASLAKWIAQGISQAGVWVLEAILTVIILAGVAIGIVITPFAAFVAFTSGLCQWTFGGWPFEPQVFQNSLIITGITFVVGVICYRVSLKYGLFAMLG